MEGFIPRGASPIGGNQGATSSCPSGTKHANPYLDVVTTFRHCQEGIAGKIFLLLFCGDARWRGHIDEFSVRNR